MRTGDYALGDTGDVGSEHSDAGVDSLGRPPRPRRADRIAAGDLSPFEADEVERDPVAGADHVHLFLVALDRADPRPPASRDDLDLAAGVKRSAGERAGDDGSRALDDERPVDPQARPPPIGGGARVGRRPVERRDEVVDSLAGHRRHRNDGGAGKHRRPEALFHLGRGQLEHVGVDQVALR